MRTAAAHDGQKWREAGLAALIVVGAWLFLAVFFDFYYDLNDDTAMKDILSGTYTGIPEGRNIQMLYPLGWAVSVLYRLLPAVPWYGCFLCFCQFFALWTIVSAAGTRAQNPERRPAVFLLLTAAGLTLLLYEFVFIQYTVTAGLLAAAALTRLLAGPDGDTGDFGKYHAVTAALCALSFYLRTEMFLLLGPFLALAVCWRLAEYRGENRQAGRGALRRYAGLAGTVVILTGAGLAADYAAYGSAEWKDFRLFFDARTAVYDFYGIPDYEQNREFYESVNVSPARYTLLQNYNFDLDTGIDTEMMERIAGYGAAHQEQGPARRLYESMYAYGYRFVHGEELFFDVLLCLAWFFLIRAALRERNRALLGKLAMLFFVRTGLWLFLLYRGRMPERITHPLYLLEGILLLWLFQEPLQWKKFEKSAILFLYAALFVCVAAAQGQTVWRQYQDREARNVQWQAWKTYCAEHPSSFYFVDVYSSVAYSEKLFADTAPAYRNFDLLGGWCVKSPAAVQKRGAAGLADAESALRAGQAFFVTDVRSEERSPEFLRDWYRERGVEITLQEEDRCGCFAVYRVRE